MTGDFREMNAQRIIRFREASVEGKPCRMAGNLRKMHSPSDASIRNSSARIYMDTYIHDGNMYLTRYGNELGMRARIPATSSASVICPRNPPVSALSLRGFHRASCHPIIVADTVHLRCRQIRTQESYRGIGVGRGTFLVPQLHERRITRISGRTVAPDLRAGPLVFSSSMDAYTVQRKSSAGDFELGTLISHSFSR